MSSYNQSRFEFGIATAKMWGCQSDDRAFLNAKNSADYWRKQNDRAYNRLMDELRKKFGMDTTCEILDLMDKDFDKQSGEVAA